MSTQTVGSRRTGTDAILAELAARGMVRRPTRKGLMPFTPVTCRGTGKTASQMIIEDREDRFSASNSCPSTTA